MEATIVLQIPKACYLSPNPQKEYHGPFSFVVTYGYLPPKKMSKPDSCGEAKSKAVKYPEIIISGFEKLLSVDKIDNFIRNLAISDDDWTIKKSGSSSDIIIKYGGLDLDPDFYFKASTDKFASDAQKNTVVNLPVKVRNFPGIPDCAYVVNTKLNYTPWAKSLTFSLPEAELNATVENDFITALNSKINVDYVCDGDNIDRRLSQNGIIVDTERTPYPATIDKPALFALEVFNGQGINDIKQACVNVHPPEIKNFSAGKSYFSEDEKITLTWELFSVSNVNLEPFGGKDKIMDNTAEVYPQSGPGEKTVSYTLRANGFINQKPGSVTSRLDLVKTLWKKNSAVSGFFAGDVYGDIKRNSRIHTIDEAYYCYAHPTIHRSLDGFNWSEFSFNDQADASFHCIATGYHQNILYVMGKRTDKPARLSITQYDFTLKTWSHAPAYQNNYSDIGSFAFSTKEKSYAQIMANGILIVKCDDRGRWNIGNEAIPAYLGKTVIGGDYLFYKDSYYAVMLCSDHYIYVYDCRQSMEDILFKKKVDSQSRFVSFAATVNKLYILTDNVVIDLHSREYVDKIYPLSGDSKHRPWYGVDNGSNLFGLFPDKNYWQFGKDEVIYDVETNRQKRCV